MGFYAKSEMQHAPCQETDIFEEIESLLSPKVDSSIDQINLATSPNKESNLPALKAVAESDQIENKSFVVVPCSNFDPKSDATKRESHYSECAKKLCPEKSLMQELTNLDSTTSENDKTSLSKTHSEKNQSESDTELDFMQSLALRTDVMNKNIFRAFTREIKSIYQNFVKENKLPTRKRSNKSFLVNIDKFAEEFR